MVTSDSNSLAESHDEKQHHDRTLSAAKADQALDADDDSIEEIQAVFDTFDENRDGKISREELRRSMAKLGFNLNESDLTTMMEATDLNGNGYVEFDEFTSLYSSIRSDQKKFSAEKDQDLWDAFCVFDQNKDGFITVRELQHVFCSLGIGKGMKQTDFENMVRGVDEDGDGQVNFPEFKVMMNSKRYGKHKVH